MKELSASAGASENWTYSAPAAVLAVLLFALPSGGGALADEKARADCVQHEKVRVKTWVTIRWLMMGKHDADFRVKVLIRKCSIRVNQRPTPNSYMYISCKTGGVGRAVPRDLVIDSIASHRGHFNVSCHVSNARE